MTSRRLSSVRLGIIAHNLASRGKRAMSTIYNVADRCNDRIYKAPEKFIRRLRGQYYRPCVWSTVGLP